MGGAPKASILLGRGKTLVSMGNVAVGAVTNIVLDALFINGFHMGVQGATLATILSQGVSAGFVIRYLCTDKSVLRASPAEYSLSWEAPLAVYSAGNIPCANAHVR